MYGRNVFGFKVWFIDKNVILDFLFIFECEDIFNDLFEILILEIVEFYYYFSVIIFKIFEFDLDLKVYLLIGRDLLEVYYVEE